MSYRDELFEAYVSTHYGEIRDLSREALEEHVPTFRHYYGDLLPQDPEAEILDVGCGHGAFLHFLEAEGYGNARGIDVAEEQIQAARDLGIDAVERADARKYLQGVDDLDCIVAIDVVEHLPKDAAFSLLEAAAGSLAPGGRIILQAPNAAGPFGGHYRHVDFTHEFALTPESARQLLRATGFADVEVRPMGPYVHGPASALRYVTWHVVRGLLWVYTVAETGVTDGHVFTRNLVAAATRKPVREGGTEP